MRVRRGDRGLTLLELVIAVLVLAMGTIAALRATDQSRVAIGGAQDRTLAALAAANLAEELKLRGAEGPSPASSVVLGGRAFELSTVRRPTAGGLVRVEITARSARGPGARRVIYVVAGP